MSGIRLIAVAALVALPAYAQSFEEPNTQRWGADYMRFAMNEQSVADCARACAADDRCRSWTFVKAGIEGKEAACHLKSAVPHGRADPCCTSGVAGGSSVSAFARVAPRERAERTLASSATSNTSDPATASSDMTPAGMTGSLGFLPAKQPALPPLAAPVTEPATDAPFSVRPESWEDQP